MNQNKFTNILSSQSETPQILQSSSSTIQAQLNTSKIAHNSSSLKKSLTLTPIKTETVLKKKIVIESNPISSKRIHLDLVGDNGLGHSFSDKSAFEEKKNIFKVKIPIEQRSLVSAVGRREYGCGDERFEHGGAGGNGGLMIESLTDGKE
jgi:hypothetical protein